MVATGQGAIRIDRELCMPTASDREIRDQLSGLMTSLRQAEEMADSGAEFTTLLSQLFNIQAGLDQVGRSLIDRHVAGCLGELATAPGAVHSAAALRRLNRAYGAMTKLPMYTGLWDGTEVLANQGGRDGPETNRIAN
jgi:DNA-binding FrmR family transcriptional regulator